MYDDTVLPVLEFEGGTQSEESWLKGRVALDPNDHRFMTATLTF